jgi:DNA-binding transcriptional LysR family regulator
MAAQRRDAGARASDVAAEEEKVGDLLHIGGAVPVLGDAHAVIDDDAVGLGVDVSDLLDIGPRQAGGLSGEIRIAAIPTVLGMVASLTTPFRARYPDVRFRIVSCTSADVLRLLENLEVDAGLTYIENEPIGRVRGIPLYNESYRLLTSPDAMFGDRDQVTWSEVGQVPLCLLTPDMQNRRIIDRALRSVGAEATPTLTSNSLLVLYTHVKTGRWASVMPAKLAETLGLADTVRSIPIGEPIVNYSIGMVIPQRDPMTPLIAALVQIAREVAPTLES